MNGLTDVSPSFGRDAHAIEQGQADRSQAAAAAEACLVPPGLSFRLTAGYAIW